MPAQLVKRAELDRVGGARLRAGGLLVAVQAVVAERALPHAPVLLAAVEDAERAGGDAVAAAVADVLLHDDRAELRPEQGAGGADLQAGGVRAVLADVRAHQPPEVALLLGRYARVAGQALARGLLRQ